LRAPDPVRRLIMRRFINLGIEDMIPGTAVWNDDGAEFTARYFRFPRTTGFMHVRLSYEEGHPMTAYVSYPGGQTNCIAYKYSSKFFNGFLPVEYTEYNEPGLTKKYFTVRVMKLDVSLASISEPDLNPAKVLAGKFRTLVTRSNDIPYFDSLSYFEKGDHKLEKILTAEDIRQQR
jgi:hypothetical protein